MTWPRVFGPSGASAAERRDLLRREGPRLSLIIANPFEPHRAREVEAIVDTGASCICVGRQLVKDLNLTRTGQTRMVAVGADHPASIFAATIRVPELDNFEKFLPVVRPDGVYSSTVLLGRSFLEFFDFTYNGPTGVFTFHPGGSEASHQHEFEE